MIKRVVLAVGAVLAMTAPPAWSETCAAYPYLLTNGVTADANQVMANFNCAALLGGANFTGAVGLNNPTISTGAQLSVTSTGNDWNEGIEINPSAVDGYSGLFLRSTANSIVSSWTVFDTNTTDTAGAHSFGVALNGLTGMSGTGRVDTPFTITTTGAARFGGTLSVGTTDPTGGGKFNSAFIAISPSGGTAIAAGYNATTPTFAVNPYANGSFGMYDGYNAAFHLDLVGINGNVGIGTASPTMNFYVNGSSGGTQGWNQASDARLKTDVRPVTNALAQVERLQGVRYRWRPAGEREVGKSLKLPTGEPRLGFIAQDVMKVVPEAVTKPRTDGDIYTLEPDTLIPLLVEAVKEQQTEIATLRAQVAALSRTSSHEPRRD